MRIYMNGTLSKKQDTFIPSALWLANDCAEDNDLPSEDCIYLEGLECECTKEGLKWSCRWKGVELTNEKEYGEDFDLADLLVMIKERKLKLANMDAYYDTDVEVKVDSIMVLDGDWGTEVYLEKDFGEEFIQEEIEFIGEE